MYLPIGALKKSLRHSPEEGSRDPARPLFDRVPQSGGVLVCETSPPKSFQRSNGGDWTEGLLPAEPTVAPLVRTMALPLGFIAGNTAFTPGSGGPPYAVATQSYAANSAQPNEWYAAPGPMKRGNMCITHVDSLPGYGFQSPFKK